MGQENRKCTSFSTNSGQNGQNLSSASIFLCRPVSIISLWFESLNLVTLILVWIFLISVRYFSKPTSFLNTAYMYEVCFYHLVFLQKYPDERYHIDVEIIF